MLLEEDDINQCAQILKRGQLVVFPTDTAYGLGCLYDNHAGIKRIMGLKGRTDDKFTVVAASLKQVEDHFQLSDAQRQLASAYWPGPLSIVVSATLSVRVPDCPTTQALASAAGKPLIATSANRTGNPATFTIEQAKLEIGESNVEGWLDVGALPNKLPSTVVQVLPDGSNKIIRQGAINLHE
ncbi:MAG: hypothetical protein COW24_06085 [Candidatus Kerfeldbacteria bacterium CG15_BIG_FIL_POST_REV_8_21_14_020_45_12]|uniref:L-threonylcarbamoyladenylate synthase n=1 Tax=Candidatus Kerfeldbacteria bacterium CG15_BIG_FIL_POST_REV_8_21_14_020_45_12 TaxID=2014247 RepID=A0A2M7H287_9BACT|nr:MAG: hypothetical protein COW24_06085 [Candidatus Kerfeldbacteria bacterium CG15_BIG_FIL_POST_REV_8_21_14_020_45_12]PJA92886.1 MAG: hypothetical protein CO132_05825 [Candidatus Kerfeldbacteria bacterium CG_4_9_14_3_um_filter_45_8]